MLAQGPALMGFQVALAQGPRWTPWPSPGFLRLRWYQKVRQEGWARGLCSSEVREAMWPRGSVCGLVFTTI